MYLENMDLDLKTKTGIAVADALKNLFKKHPPPAMLWTDKGNCLLYTSDAADE